MPLTVRLDAAVSGSPIVKGIAGVGVFTVVARLAISLMTGGAEVGPVVVNVRLQPVAMLPWSPGPSSATYSDHAPFGLVPLKAANAVPYPVAFKGAGNTSP